MFDIVYIQGAGSYSKAIKKVEEDIKNSLKKVNELTGKMTCSVIRYAQYSDMLAFSPPLVTTSILLCLIY